MRVLLSLSLPILVQAGCTEPREAPPPAGLRPEAVHWVEAMRGLDMSPRRPRSDGPIDPEQERREEIVAGLRAEAADGVRALAAALSDPAAEQRVAAARVLAELGGDWAGPPVDLSPALDGLRAATHAEPAELRSLAAHALSSLGPTAAPAVPDLIPLLIDEDPAPRNTACMALAAIGPAASPALPALREARRRASDEVHRGLVERALASIEGS